MAINDLMSYRGNQELRGRRQTAGNAATSAPAATAGNSALNTLWNSDVYQFPVQQGLDAINASYAGRGALQSGAAMKGIADYVSGVAAPGAFNSYMGYLGDQQSMGYGAALGQAGVGQNYGSALTGLGTNYANSAANINTNLANAQSAGAQNIGNIYSNQAIAGANNTNSMISGIGNALGGVAGYYAYSPYS